MKRIRNYSIALLVLGFASHACAQSKLIRPFTQEEITAMDRSGHLVVSAEGLLHDGKASQALAMVLESVAIVEAVTTIYIPGDYYLVARCHLALGQRDEALADFKKSFFWDARMEDLTWGLVDAAADYAVLLAKVGRVEDAKQMYYWAMRNLGGDGVHDIGDREHEPYPFLVVFDPCPGGDVQPYSTDRFEAACLEVKAISSSAAEDNLVWVDRASRLAPDWLYPVLFRCFVWPDDKLPAYLARARAMADTPEKRALVELVASYDRAHMPASAPYPAVLRSKLAILQASRKELAKNYKNLVNLSQRG